MSEEHDELVETVTEILRNLTISAVYITFEERARAIIPIIQEAEREKWAPLGWKILPMLKGVQSRQKNEGVTWKTGLDVVIIELSKALNREIKN